MTSRTRSSSVLTWSYCHGFAMLLALLLAWWYSSSDALVFTALFSFAIYAWLHKSGGLPGYANALTLFRLLLLLVVAHHYMDFSKELVASLLIGSLVLDGFDGYLARRYNESSEFGQYFDVETDAFAILLLSFLLWQQQGISAGILLAGSLRYLYLWIIRLTVREQRIEPKRRYASIVAVTAYIVMTTRLTLGGELFNVPVLDWALWISVAALYASFLRSAIYQWG